MTPERSFLSPEKQTAAVSAVLSRAARPCTDLRENFHHKICRAALIGSVIAGSGALLNCTQDFDRFRACTDPETTNPDCTSSTGGSGGSGAAGGMGGNINTTGGMGGTGGVAEGGKGGMGGVGGSAGGPGGVENGGGGQGGAVNVGGMGGMGGVGGSAGGTGGTGGGGIVGNLSDAAGENECIHWLVTDAGTTVDFQDDTHDCLTKPLGDIPLAAGQDVYLWADDPASNNRVALTLQGLTATSFVSKCSAYPVPPNQAEMETELFAGGYVATTNLDTLPDVALANAGCADGAAFVVHVE